MKIYFLSSQPCMLTLNDAYFGVTDHFERFAEVHLSDRIFVKFTPQGSQPIGFFLTESLRFEPPAGCEVYLLRDGIAVYARDFPPTDLSLHVIAQQRFDDCLVTIFRQGTIQMSVESPENFFIATLPPSFASCKLSFYENLLFIESQNMLIIYTKQGTCLFHERFLEYSIHENTLNATLPLSDRLQRVAKCSWTISDNSCMQTQFTISQPTYDTQQESPDNLLAYAFFESVLIGADYEAFLASELQIKKDKIKTFLGDFTSVILTDNPNTCGLVQKKKERLYEVVYYTVEVENGKITDVHG